MMTEFSILTELSYQLEFQSRMVILLFSYSSENVVMYIILHFSL